VRLIIDTNVVVSGLLWLGNPGRLLEAAALGKVTLYTSPALLNELAATLATPKLVRPVVRSGLSVEDLLARYADITIVIQPTNVPRIVPNDPDDDQVLAAAVAADADLIVSGDMNLKSLGNYNGIPILSPAECLARISG
jgi:putative PIN family toxin of toxin-antitoxin system